MFRASSTFDRLLERATSNLLLEPDWDANLNICDSIRAGDVAPKYAVAAIKKKFYSENPHVVLYALMLMESCVKNCGNLVHDEVCTKSFMEELRELVKHATDENVKQKVLEMLQTWGMAFRNQPKYRIVTDTLNLMKAEGWKFPPVREAEAMFEADIAPNWSDGEVCHRCRVQFGIMTRQHHCRGCGQVFCSKCSSKACPIPRFGIEKEVRVCDPCFDKFGPKETNGGPSTPKRTIKTVDDIPADFHAARAAQKSRAAPPNGGKTEAEMKEEEDLQLAIALSQSEAEEKEKLKLSATSKILAAAAANNSNIPVKQEDKSPDMPEEELAPELMRYLNRNYWEQQQKELAANTQSPAKAAAIEVEHKPKSPAGPKSALKNKIVKNYPEQDEMLPSYSAATGNAAPASSTAPVLVNKASDEELDEFVTTLKTQVEIFVNRMKSNSSRGRPIANDSSVQTLFMNTMAMHSKLLRHIQEQEDCRVYYEGLQDKITQVRDARAALDALREEERERRRREAEEAERIRQIQMQEKLEVMRQKKQEYLQYQRQLALQRMQEQEREMLLRKEQAKQQYIMHQQQGGVGAGPQPMFHPAMYGQMPPGAPMQAQGMMGGSPYQPYLPPGQYPSMPGMPSQPSTTGSLPGGPIMSQGPMSMGGAMPPNTTSAGDMGQPQHMPPMQQPQPQGHPQGSFNMQGMGAALPTYPPHMGPPQASGAQPQVMMGQQPPMNMMGVQSPMQQQHGHPPQMSHPTFDSQELISFD